jgi:hypothetical protein
MYRIKEYKYATHSAFHLQTSFKVFGIHLWWTTSPHSDSTMDYAIRTLNQARAVKDGPQVKIWVVEDNTTMEVLNPR